MNILSLRLSLQARQTPGQRVRILKLSISNGLPKLLPPTTPKLLPPTTEGCCGAGAVEVTGIRYLRLRLHCAAHQTGLLEASAIR